MNVNVHIERLILEGYELGPHQQAQLQETIKSELSVLIARHGWQTIVHNSQYSGHDVATSKIGPSIDGTSLGRQIARSVYRGKTI